MFMDSLVPGFLTPSSYWVRASFRHCRLANVQEQGMSECVNIGSYSREGFRGLLDVVVFDIYCTVLSF